MERVRVKILAMVAGAEAFITNEPSRRRIDRLDVIIMKDMLESGK